LAPAIWGDRTAYGEKKERKQQKTAETLSVSVNDDSETSAKKKREQDIAPKKKISQHPRPV
jgi:hypothetical protein